MNKKNLAVFISGYGSNLNVFLKNKDAFNKVLVVSSNPEAYGLVRAQNHGVESLTLDKKINWSDLNEQLLSRQVDLIFLAGFMRIVPPSFVEKWQGALYNLHPSKLPSFKGLKAIERAWKAGEEVGVSIHHVTPEVDDGKVILQQTAVEKDRVSQLSLDEVTRKTHEVEHQLVARWIEQFK